MPGLFRNPQAGLASQLAMRASAEGFEAPIEIEKPPTALDWLNKEDFLLDTLPEAESSTIIKAMARLRARLPKVSRAGALSTGEKVYMEATIAPMGILGYDKLIGATVTPKSFDVVRMFSDDDLIFGIDKNTPFGEVVVVYPRGIEDDPREMRIFSELDPDDQELYDLIDFMETTYEPSPDFDDEGPTLTDEELEAAFMEEE